MLNRMCYECSKLNNDCSGTTCQVWNGCIYKETNQRKSQLLIKLELLETYEKQATKAEAAYENAPENIEKEKFFDTCYKKEFNAFIALANAIVNFTDGKVDFQTAKKIIATQKQELYTLLTA